MEKAHLRKGINHLLNGMILQVALAVGSHFPSEKNRLSGIPVPEAEARAESVRIRSSWFAIVSSATLRCGPDKREKITRIQYLEVYPTSFCSVVNDVNNPTNGSKYIRCLECTYSGYNFFRGRTAKVIF